MDEKTKTIIDRARALLAAATPGPWEVCPDTRPDVRTTCNTGGFLGCGHIATVSRYDANEADAALIAAAPGLLATLCDAMEAAERRAEEAEELYRSIKAKVGQTPGDGRMVNHAIDALMRRAEEAEAQAAAALECVASSAHKLWTLPPVDRTLATDAVWRDLAYFKPSAAGRALLDRLHAAETERDALRDSLALVTAECARLRSDIDLEREQSAAFVQEIERLRVVEAGAAVLRHLLNNVGRSVEWSRQVRECLHESAGLQYLDQFRSVELDLADSMAKVAELQGDVAALQRDLSSAEKECRMLRAEVERNGGCCSSGAVIVGQAGEEGQ